MAGRKLSLISRTTSYRVRYASAEDFAFGSNNVPTTGQPHFDLILVYPANQNSDASAQKRREGRKNSYLSLVGDFENQRRVIAARARSIGLQAVVDLSRDEDEYFLKLSAPDHILLQMAEQLTMEKALWDGGYTDFQVKDRDRFVPDSETCFFSSLERVRLLQALLTLPQDEGGCSLHLDDLVESGVLTAVVPIHELGGRRAQLMRDWVRAPCTFKVDQPLDDIRDYFGEKLGFYYAFTQELTNALVLPAALGVLLFLVSTLWYEGSNDNIFTCLYSLVILVWFTWFGKVWTRAQAKLAFRWNVMDFEETERQRPEFTGPRERGFYSEQGYWVAVDQKDPYATKMKLTKKFLPSERLTRMIKSYLIVTPFLVAIIVATAAILAYKSSLMLSFYVIFASDHSNLTPSKFGVTLGSALGGMLNGLFIALSNMLYAKVARRLNDYENHRTQTSFDNALIVKTMFFQFVNSYVALYYIAFIKANQIDVISWATHVHEFCHDYRHYNLTEADIERGHGGLNPYCMNELSLYMTSVVISAMLVGKAVEFLGPFLKARLRHAQEEFAMHAAATPHEETFIEQVVFIVRFMLGRHAASAKASTASGEAAAAPIVLPPMSLYEEQAKLEPFEGVFSEYSRLVIQLGYIILFAPAFPLASALLWASFYSELRTDAFKMVANTRRPIYLGAEDIGAWQMVLRLLSILGVLTNLGLVGITQSTLKRMLPFHFLYLVEINEENKIIFLIVLEHLLLLAQYVVVQAIPDIPEDLAVETALQQWRATAHRQPDPPPPEHWDDEALLEQFPDRTGSLAEVPLPALDVGQSNVQSAATSEESEDQGNGQSEVTWAVTRPLPRSQPLPASSAPADEDVEAQAGGLLA